MATTTFLSNATVNITQGMKTYDMSDQVSAITLTVGYAELDATSMGDLGSKAVPGLQTVEVSMTLFLSYGTDEVEAMMADIVGKGNTTLVISPSGTSEFDFKELATVVSVLNEQRKEMNNANKRKR
jgi:hypothetical protein